FAFVHVIEAARFLRPTTIDMLGIGLGIGSLPGILDRQGIKADVVEIDPAVVHFARQYFGFSTRGEVHIEDPPTYLIRTPNKHARARRGRPRGGTTPERLLGIAVPRGIREVLRPGGVLVLNLVGYDSGVNVEGAGAVTRTIRAVFPNVRVFRDSPPNERPGEP